MARKILKKIIDLLLNQSLILKIIDIEENHRFTFINTFYSWSEIIKRFVKK